MITRLAWAFLVGLLTTLGLGAVLAQNVPTPQTPSVTVSGQCSVAVVASPEARVRVEGCGRTARDTAAFKVIEQRLNAIIESERIEGARLRDLVSAVNLWFPVLSMQIESVQSEVQRSIAEASREILSAVRSSKSTAELTTAFLAVAERRISGSPLSKCSCENPTDIHEPYETFQRTAPNSFCISGIEKYEACVSEKEESCRTRTWNKGYPPFRRICK